MLEIKLKLKSVKSGEVVTTAVLKLNKDDDLNVINEKYNALENQLFRNRSLEQFELDRSELDSYVNAV